MKIIKVLSVILTISIVFCGCSMANQERIEPSEEISVSKSADDIINIDDMFTDRDVNYDYSEKNVYNIALKDNASKSDSKNATIKGNIITINAEGVYVLRGSLSNGQIVINAGDNDKIQLVLDSVNINCNTSASIYCKNAKKLFVTTINDSTLSNKEDFENNDENINGVIYSKSDLTLNGSKKLTINAIYGNAIAGNDDLAITSGEYDLTSAKHTIKANDSIRIANAKFNLNATKDAIHCENDEVEKGFIYIESGDFTINAVDDGIQASSAIKICDGTINIQKSKEGIEGRFIDVAGGRITIVASDDGFNATDKSENNNSEQANNTPPAMPSDDKQQSSDMQTPPDMPTPPNMDNQERPEDMPIDMRDNKEQGQKSDFGGFENGSTDCSLIISGGIVNVNASGDGLDSNGIIKITGGETIVYGAENNGNCAFDYQTQATITGGSIIAIGMSGMAEGFSDSSTQYSILYNLDAEGSADDKIELLKGKTSIISTTAIKKYNSILISSPDISKGKYTLIVGDTKESIKIKSITYSNSNGFDIKGKPNKDYNNKEFKQNNK